MLFFHLKVFLITFKIDDKRIFFVANTISLIFKEYQSTQIHCPEHLFAPNTLIFFSKFQLYSLVLFFEAFYDNTNKVFF
jgi:hypothetical protein